MNGVSNFILISFLSAAIPFLNCCSNSKGEVSSPNQVEARPSPQLNQVLESTLSASRANLYLSSYDRDYNLSYLRLEFASTSKTVSSKDAIKVQMQPLLVETYSSGGTGGLLRYSDFGNLEDVDFEDAVAAIEQKGLVSSSQLWTGAKTLAEAQQLVEAAKFTPGSIWIFSIQARGRYTFAVQLGEEFSPDIDVNRSLKIRYKVLEFKPD
jgi:hypothetical protein